MEQYINYEHYRSESALAVWQPFPLRGHACPMIYWFATS
jgi:hypothetical protein